MAWAFTCLLLVRIKIGRFSRDNNSLNAIKIKKSALSINNTPQIYRLT